MPVNLRLGAPKRLVFGALSATVVLMIVAFAVGYVWRAPDQTAFANSQQVIRVSARAELKTPPVPTTLGLVGTRVELKVGATRPAGAVTTQITAAPLPAGAAVDEGAVLFAVADRPLIALSLNGPHYRDLASGDSGDDVRVLNDALARLGYDTDPGSGDYDWRTRDAVAALYDDRGYVAASAPAPVAPAQSTPAPVATGSAAATTTAAIQPDVGSFLPFSEIYDLPAGAYVVGSAPALYAVLDDDATAMTIVSPVSNVVSRADAEQVRQVTVGQAVHLIESTSGRSGAGTVTAISEFAPASTGNDGKEAIPGYDVTVELDDATRGVFSSGSTVSLQFAAAQPAVVAVPASALHLDGTKTYVLTADEATPSRVDVVVSTIADGWALLTSGNISEGTAVQVG